MCKCTPEIRTPWCGKIGCEPPADEPSDFAKSCVKEPPLPTISVRPPTIPDILSGKFSPDGIGYSTPQALAASLKPDMVNHPPHYTSSKAACSKCGYRIECIDVTRHMGFNLGNAMKYIWRALFKGATIEDLEKCVWYIQDEIKQRKKEKANVQG